MNKTYVNRLISSVVFCLSFFQCTRTHESETVFADAFKKYAVEGTFVFHKLHANQTYFYNNARANTPYLPASTFKILNSLIALETGAIADTNVVLKWDGIEHSIKAWNRDHNMKSAIKVSAVWFYQELACRIGPDKMQYLVEKCDYGNKNIGSQVDTFWLNGDLRISALEQVEFLKKLYNNELPFSKSTVDKVKDILIVEEGENYTLRAKTGWGGERKPQIGWFVGWLENNNEIYIFALNLDINQEEDAKYRARVVKEILHNLGLLK